MIASAACNPHIKKALSAADFMPKFKKNVGITDPDEIEALFRGMCVGA